MVPVAVKHKSLQAVQAAQLMWQGQKVIVCSIDLCQCLTAAQLLQIIIHTASVTNDYSIALESNRQPG